MGKCNHYWNIVHTVYGGPRGGTLVRRFCSKCPKEQVGVVERWRPPKPNEFDHTAREASKSNG